MKPLISHSVITVLLAAAPVIAAPEDADRRWVPADPKIECAAAANKTLCAELLAMNDADQLLMRRHEFAAEGASLSAELSALQAANLRRVASIVQEVGWPGKTLVGIRAGGGAWAIVQHGDLATQERFVGLMQKAAESAEIEPALVAMTVDRIRVGQGKPQVYGSQFREVDGKHIPEPIEDPSHVDERRAKVGLPPLAEYEALMNQFYGARQASPHPPTPTPSH